MHTSPLCRGLVVFAIGTGIGLLGVPAADANRSLTPGSSVIATRPDTGTSSLQAAVTLDPERPRAGTPTTMLFSFTHPDGSAVGDLVAHHARRVHTMIVSRDLRTIGHIHPQDFGKVTDEVVRSGRYAVSYTFPRAGAYIVGVDVMTANEALSKQFVIHVAGAPKMGDVAPRDLRREKCFRGYRQDGHDRYVHPVELSRAEVPCPQGYQITLTPSSQTVTAGETVRLRYRIEQDGAGVTDLEPYLDAAIHLAMVPASFDTLLHHHGTPATVGQRNGEAHANHHRHGMNAHGTGNEPMAHARHEMHHVPGAASHHGHDASAAPMHQGRAGSMHHGSVPASFGPVLVSEPFRFPHPGLYQVFGQVKHDGKIIFSSFMIEVQE